MSAKNSKLNPGVLDSSGGQIQHPARVWVDDTHIAVMGTAAMKMALTAVIEVMFVVMDEPNLTLRQCPLAMDRWRKLVIAEKQLALGLILKTREMVVAITDDYLVSTLQLLKTSWPKSKKRFLPWKLQQWLKNWLG